MEGVDMYLAIRFSGVCFGVALRVFFGVVVPADVDGTPSPPSTGTAVAFLFRLIHTTVLAFMK